MAPPPRAALRPGQGAWWMMMTYEFLLTLDVNGSSEQRSFRVAASTLSCAVTRSLDQLAQEKPNAQFKGLTYYTPPVESPALPWAEPTGTASAV
jgi:hypothetical protein